MTLGGFRDGTQEQFRRQVFFGKALHILVLRNAGIYMSILLKGMAYALHMRVPDGIAAS